MALIHHGITSRTAMQLVGYRREASLNEDLEQHIVSGMRTQLYNQLQTYKPSPALDLYLIQVYPCIPWTPDTIFSSIVAVEQQGYESMPTEGMIQHVSPAGDFYSFTYEGTEQNIDQAYDEIRQWLAQHGIEDSRPYDIECWPNIQHASQELTCIHIYIPVHVD